MKIAFVAGTGTAPERNRKDIQGQLAESFSDIEMPFFFRKGKEDILSEIKGFDPDLLMTWNLEGFEMCTIMDAIAYNLLHCRQLHLLSGTGWNTEENRKILTKQLSLTMFLLWQ